MACKSLFSCRIVDISSYNATPVKDLDVCYSEFRSSAVAKVPVVRIFGSTPSGQKTCLHVHGIFPYIYVPCPFADPSNRYLQQLALGVDQALQLSLGARPSSRSEAAVHHVFKITVVKGIPMYGYHDNEELFLKIYLYNPSLVKRLAELLVAGVVMNTVMQPHEAHIPFVLQVMIDYNLYGMNYIHLSSVKFRAGRDVSPVQRSRSSSLSSPPLLSTPTSSGDSSFTSSLLPSPSQQVWNVDSLPGSMMVCIPRVSESELEVDGLAADIMNTQQITLAQGGFPGLAAIWEEERQRRQQLGLTASLTPPPSPDRVYDSTEPVELTAKLASIIQDRLGESFSPADSSPQSLDLDPNIPLSRDTESHQPIRSEDSDPGVVARRLSMGDNEEEGKGEGPLVNQEAMHQAMELSQKLRIEALRKSTDEELLDLMLELAQTQVGVATQPSQSAHQTPTVVHSLCRQLSRSLSASSRPAGAGHSVTQSQPVGDTAVTGFTTSLTGSSQPIFNSGTTNPQIGRDGEEPTVAAMQWQDTANFLVIAGEDLLNKTDEINTTSKTSFTGAETERHNNNNATTPAECQGSPLQQTGTVEDLSTPLPQSPVFSDTDLFETDFPVDPLPSLPPSTPPGVPFHKEGDTVSELGLQLSDGEILPDASVMLNSSVANMQKDDELECSPDFESPFDIPCAQPVPSQRSSSSSDGQDQGLVYEATEGDSGNSGSLRNDAGAVKRCHSDGSVSSEGRGRSVEVQLEYEMPEISLSQFESTTTEILGTPSKMEISCRDNTGKPLVCAPLGGSNATEPCFESSVAKLEDFTPQRMGDSIKTSSTQMKTSTPFQKEDTISQREVASETSSSSICLSASQRRTLLRQLCSAGGEDGELSDGGEGGGGGGGGEGGGLGWVAESETEEDEEESEWRSGQWNNEPLTIPESPQGQSASEICHIGQWDGCISPMDDTISQLDGTSDDPKTGSLKRKTLGVSRQRLVHTKSTADTGSGEKEDREEEMECDTNPREKKSSLRTDITEMRKRTVTDAVSTASSDTESGGLETETWERDSECPAPGRKRVRGNKSKLSLSLSSRKRRRPCNPSSSSPSSSSSSPLTTSADRVLSLRGPRDINAHPLATQWKANAIQNPPRVSLHRLSSSSVGTARFARGHVSEECEKTPQQLGNSDVRGSRGKARRASKRRLTTHRVIGTRSRATNMIVSEKDQLSWALHESLRDINNESASINDLPPSAGHSETSSDFACKISPSCEDIRMDTSTSGTLDGKNGEERNSHSGLISSHSEASLISESISAELSPSCRYRSDHSYCSATPGRTDSSLLQTIADPERAERELRLSCGGNGVAAETDTSPSEASSQGVESEFNLIMTESESESDERPLPLRSGKRRKIDTKSGMGKDSCAFPRTVVTLNERLSPFHSGTEAGMSPFCINVEEKQSPFHFDVEEMQSPFHSEVEENQSSFHSEVEEKQSPVHSDVDQRLSPSRAFPDKPTLLQFPPPKIILRPLQRPPSPTRITETASSYGLPSAVHRKPFYSNPGDVQPPKEVNGKLVRIPSNMPYDLPEAEPLILVQEGRHSTPLSTTGLHHWRTVLSMLNSASPSTEIISPPTSHPPRAPKTNHQPPHYTIEDHKCNLQLRSAFLPTEKTFILTPLQAPPHPLVVRKWLDSKIATKKSSKSENSSTTDTENHPLSVLGDGGVIGGAPVVIETESSSSNKSPNVSQLCQEQASFTSYQIPKQQRAQESDSVTASIDCRKNIESESRLVNNSASEEPAQRDPMNVTFTPVSVKRDTSQLEGPTPQNPYGFKTSQSGFATSSDTHEYLTIMSVELHIRTRGNLRPDPEWDPILTLFYYIHYDYPHSIPGRQSGRNILGAIAIDIKNCGFQAVNITRHTKGKRSPRKRPIKSPHKSPAKSQTAQPIKSPKKPASNEASIAKTCNQTPGGGCGLGVQSSQTLTSPVVAKGYLYGCVSGEDVDVMYVSSETELLEALVTIIRRHDPDILLGYEVTMMSWGYLIDRAAALNTNLTNQLSRIPHQSGSKPSSDRTSSGIGTRHSSSQVHVPGRIIVSVWKLLRRELALTSYTFENTFFQVMHQRVPMFPFQTLTHWYEMGTHANRVEVVEYYLLRCHGNYQLLEKLNVIGRTSEFARLYGIEFENVLTRGSQYRVESMLLRLAKPANYIAVSPSVQQRARMAAPECLPLILEPESKFYSDPVIVLDFQSLYPSIVIGYNYCYTTCLGRVRNLALHDDFVFGTNSLFVPPHVLKRVKNNITISPNGVAFVTLKIRRGLMPRMLEEILGTRIMVKNSMKQHTADKALNRMLDARQMGLKLIANVTYGYAAANFSGRMPCVEIADSIVGKARETLERAVTLISNTPEWRARVVYGDTDSVFVLLKGASKDEAFCIGREICERVTADNPKPVKLKFEKVYCPCILQTKKRYCGFMYETPDQTEPRYDAKGIETVRRDTCPAVAKILQKSLSLLFTTYDVSQVKSYVQRQASKLLDGHVAVQDYILAKEYRGRGNYRLGACVPSLELARRATELDPRAEPRPGERVPYVVVYGHPGQPLIQLVRPPLEVVKDPSLRLNGIYYITKQVLPALDRALSLLGVDVYQWYNELPRTFRAPLPQLQEAANRKLKGTLGQYFATMHCPICDMLTTEGVCSRCRDNPQKVATVLSQQIHDLESAHHSVTMLCHNCTRSTDPTLPTHCLSLDCPVFYRRHHTLHTLPTVTKLTQLLHSTL